MPDRKDEKRPIIEIIKNGPIKISHLKNFYRANGEKIPPKDVVYLCRCGASENKPYCDGKHVESGFTGDKEDDRSADKWKVYTGDKINVRDNRGICSHSGECTRGLPSVFNVDNRPWINPAGAEAQEIMDIIKKCPSGALQYEYRNRLAKDFTYETAVHICKNGALNITGDVELIDPEGNRPPAESHFALCRCGASKNKPFCDGSHGKIDFRDDKN